MGRELEIQKRFRGDGKQAFGLGNRIQGCEGWGMTACIGWYLSGGYSVINDSYRNWEEISPGLSMCWVITSAAVF